MTQLVEQHDILSAVIENVSLGLSYFDKDLNLVTCNRRYLELLDFPDWMGAPGTPMAAFLRHNAERGEYGPGNVDNQVAQRLALAREAVMHNFERVRPDGTVLRIRGIPLADGSFVTTYDDITELRGSQKALEETNERLDDLVLERTMKLRAREEELSNKNATLESILEAVTYGISLFDRNLRLVAANRQMFEIMGIPDSFRKPGQNFEEMVRFMAERGEYGEGCTEEQVKSRVDLARRFEEHSFVRTQPSGRVIEVTGHPVADGFVTTYVDVTEQKNFEAMLQSSNQALAKQSAALETILSAVNYGISLFDEDMKLVAVNPQALDLMAIPRELATPGRPFQDFLRHQAARGEFGPGEIEDIVRQRVEIAKSPEPTTSIRYRKNGTIIEVSRRPVEHGFVTTYRDVTEEKRLEDLLRSTNEELEKRVEERTAELNSQLRETERAEAEMRAAKSRAEDADQAKSDFLARMSHEIRTPLNGIIGLNRILGETALTERQADYVRKIRTSSDSLLTVVNDILDFSKIESGRLDMEEIPFSLSEMLENASASSSVRAEEKGLQFEIDAGPAKERRFIGDPHRLGQILSNFLGNAVKFTETGYVRLTASIEAEDAGRAILRFAIVDSGIGMSREAAERIFQPFTQADASTTRKFGGTGLGLAICREIADQMSGRVWVKSAPDMGSTFYLEVPLVAAPDENSPDTRKNTDWKSACKGLRVLLVEDNLINREIATLILEGAGVDVTTAEHGRQAVDLMLASDPPPIDVVLMDLQMPEMDGHEATRTILADPRHGKLRIIALTAHAVAEEIDKCREEGMCGHISKPFEPETLFRHLAQCRSC